jgi:hypothetical protein
MSTSAPDFFKLHFLDFEKIEIKYPHIHKHSEGKVIFLENNMLHFELYKKKDKIVTNFYPYT